MFTDKERKLLRLALGQGAMNGEIDNAAVMLLRSLRCRGITADQVENIQPGGGETIYVETPASKPDWGLTVWRWKGPHQGSLYKDIPPDYLRRQRKWILEDPIRAERFSELAESIEKFLDQ